MLSLLSSRGLGPAAPFQLRGHEEWASLSKAVQGVLAGTYWPEAGADLVFIEHYLLAFAGQHQTLLNVPSVRDLAEALREIWWSANSDAAITYRKKVGLFSRPSVGVVVQKLLAPDTAGVLFTRNPISGADERVIEASWGASGS